MQTNNPVPKDTSVTMGPRSETQGGRGPVVGIRHCHPGGSPVSLYPCVPVSGDKSLLGRLQHHTFPFGFKKIEVILVHYLI